MSNQRGLRGLKALVIGGSGGIGRSISRAIALEGARVVVHGANPGKVSSFVSELNAEGLEAIARPRSFERAGDAEDLARAELPLDILVVSFGPFFDGGLADHTVEAWERIVSLNLCLPGVLVSTVLPSMAERGFGRILLFGGTNLSEPRGSLRSAAYTSAKAGLLSLAKSVALEYGPKGVFCNLICPGFVDTEYVDEAFRGRMKALAGEAGLDSPEVVSKAALLTLLGKSNIANGAALNARGV